MKALSLTQPWASVILHQGKRIENRQRWAGCSYRGPILIHAAKSVGTISDFDSVIVKLLNEMAVPITFVSKLAYWGPRRGHRSDVWSPLPTLARGGIVGRVRVVGEIRSERDMAAYAANVHGGEEQRRWWFGGFALVLDDVEPLPFVPWKGALGFFDVPESVVAAREDVATWDAVLP